jgi:hypothetical protein
MVTAARARLIISILPAGKTVTGKAELEFILIFLGKTSICTSIEQSSSYI